jgi:hypothetical protein
MQRLRSCFFVSAGIILVITGVAKIWSAFGSAGLLVVIDPLFRIRFSHLLLLAGNVELLVACFCFFGRRHEVEACMLALLATTFMGYRLGLILAEYHRPCSCLGNLTDALHISPQLADNVMKGVLAYLLIGSYATLFWLWRQHRKAIPASAPVQ